MIRAARRYIAEMLYQFARVEEDPHMRRTLRRVASRFVPRPEANR